MPKTERTLRLGTRASTLALAQSGMIARKLERLHPGLNVEMVQISTTGDRVTNKALKDFGGAGVFVKELESALLDGRIDLAVHSLKDMPTRQPRGLVIGAVAGREDPRDCAVVKGGVLLEDLKPGSVIGSGSLRRRAQLKIAFPQLEFAEIRGNIDTRIRKVHDGEFAGTILARAGLKRAKLLSRATETLPLSLMLPAPGQGALGLECRLKDRTTLRLIKPLHNAQAAACVNAERALLQALGGGCHLPLGALAVVRNGKLTLRAFLGLPDGSASCTAEEAGAVSRPEALGKKIAAAMMELGAREILKQLEKS
ncbi:MAG TPA: hydroxymethylbilane synthase [Planctomycetota bacterium]|nr:hydroxymethylbilane synthase [Planctomycetota bacterium]